MAACICRGKKRGADAAHCQRCEAKRSASTGPCTRWLACLLLPALLLAAACEDSAGLNRGPSGRYVLAKANGSPLPALITRAPTGVEGRVVSGSADFHSPGRVTIALTMAWSGPNVAQPTTFHELNERYHTNGPLLEFDGSSTTGVFDAGSVTITHEIVTRWAGHYVKQ